jgi:hypothetical protein
MSVIRVASIFAAVLMLMPVTGCGGMNVEEAKSQVRELHEKRLQYLLDKDAQSLVAMFGPEVVDLGGGASGTGEMPSEYYTAAYWQEWFASESYDRVFAGKTVNQLVNVNNAEAYTYAEIQEMGLDEDFGKGTLYKPGDDDIWISFPPAEGSPLNDGWFGVYRKLDGKWKLVGID